MKTLKYFLPYFIVLLLTVFHCSAAFKGPIESVEQVLGSVPTTILQHLANKNTEAQGQAEINKYFGTHIINQQARLRIKVDFSEATPNGRNKYRIRAVGIPVPWKGGTMNCLNWFYFPAANIPNKDSVRVGSEIVVFGIVRRCEVVTVAGALRINFDLVESKLEEGPKAPH